jgi:hypothetical protein
MRYDEVVSDRRSSIIIVDMKDPFRAVQSEADPDMPASARVERRGTVDPDMRDAVGAEHERRVVRSADEVHGRIRARIAVGVPVLGVSSTREEENGHRYDGVHRRAMLTYMSAAPL